MMQEKIDSNRMCDILGEMTSLLYNGIDDDIYYIDDCGWGDDCFIIKLFDAKTDKLESEFFFRYDPNDIDDRTCYEQAEEKLIRWIKEL